MWLLPMYLSLYFVFLLATQMFLLGSGSFNENLIVNFYLFSFSFFYRGEGSNDFYSYLCLSVCISVYLYLSIFLYHLYLYVFMSLSNAFILPNSWNSVLFVIYFLVDRHFLSAIEDTIPLISGLFVALGSQLSILIVYQ